MLTLNVPLWIMVRERILVNLLQGSTDTQDLTVLLEKQVVT